MYGKRAGGGVRSSRHQGFKLLKTFYSSVVVRIAAALLAAFSMSMGAEAACGQQKVLRAISPLGAGVVASVRRDQQQMIAVAAESAGALRSSGIDEKVVQKFLIDFQLSVPIYCLFVSSPPGNRRDFPPVKDTENQGAHRAIETFIRDMKRRYPKLPNTCSDCKVSDAWNVRYFIAMNIWRLDDVTTDSNAKRERIQYAQVHHDVTVRTIRYYIDGLSSYRWQ
jgi:hypothetical protein